jgi:hypothetical protein
MNPHALAGNISDNAIRGGRLAIPTDVHHINTKALVGEIVLQKEPP